jgi:hypothetical protein
VCDGQCIGRLFSHRFLDTADAVVDGMELIVKVVEWLIDPFAAFGGLGRGFRHIRQIDQRFDSRCSLCFRRKVLRVWVK